MVCFVLFLSLILSFPLVLVSYVLSFFQRDARALIHIIFSVVELPQHLAAQKNNNSNNDYIPNHHTNEHVECLRFNNSFFSSSFVSFCSTTKLLCEAAFSDIYSFVALSVEDGWDDHCSQLFTHHGEKMAYAHTHIQNKKKEKKHKVWTHLCAHFQSSSLNWFRYCWSKKNALTLMCAHGVWLHV